MARKDHTYILAAACAEAGARQPEHVHLSRGRPSTRAPHMLLERNGKRLCTCFLFGEHFVLLTGADGAAWCDAALQVATGSVLSWSHGESALAATWWTWTGVGHLPMV